MADATNYLEDEILDHILGDGARTFTQPTGLIVKLHTGDPGEVGTANAALETTTKSVTFGASSAGVASNTNTLTWTNVSTTESYAWVSILDGAANVLCKAQINAGTPVSVTAGDTFEIAIGDLDISLD